MDMARTRVKTKANYMISVLDLVHLHTKITIEFMLLFFLLLLLRFIISKSGNDEEYNFKKKVKNLFYPFL